VPSNSLKRPSIQQVFIYIRGVLIVASKRDGREKTRFRDQGAFRTISSYSLGMKTKTEMDRELVT
jgi:hypothetical protein